MQAARDSSRNLAATHQSSAPDINLLSELPSMDGICARVQITKEYVEHDVLALAEPEFLRCVANAAHFHDKDAFTFVGTDEDTDWRKRCRVAWIELFMFSKTCLPQLPGGKAKANHNKNLLINRLERWRGGERATPYGRRMEGSQTVKDKFKMKNNGGNVEKTFAWHTRSRVCQARQSTASLVQA